MLSLFRTKVKHSVKSDRFDGLLISLARSRALLILWLALTAGAALAQSTQVGHVAGRLADPSGGPVVGATVVIEGERLFSARDTVTDGEGQFAFRNLPVGVYVVTAVMDGFQTLKKEGVKVSLGFTSEYRWTMALSGIETTLVVTSEQPLIDATSPAIGKNFTSEELSKTPVSKDPWGVINMVAGVNLSRIDGSGNQAGTQARFAGPGVNQFQNAYFIDGVNITDTAATGASSQYFNPNRFAEIQVATGAHDPSIQTAGVVLNMVSRSGSNQSVSSGS